MIIGIGDIHGQDIWKEIINKESKYDYIVFVGDYFDSFDISTDIQINNFLDIIEFKKSNPEKVKLLIGNHDIHYFSSVGNTGTSGYQKVGNFHINPVIEANKEYLQMCFQTDKYLFTHAGVGDTFMDITFGKEGWHPDDVSDLLNELWINKPRSFIFNGFDPYGEDISQTPVWIRPRSLIRASKRIRRENYIQIVGHTGQESILKNNYFTDKYYFIDTLPREYLVIDKEVKAGKI